jgi:hypothetical protein
MPYLRVRNGYVYICDKVKEKGRWKERALKSLGCIYSEDEKELLRRCDKETKKVLSRYLEYVWWGDKKLEKLQNFWGKVEDASEETKREIAEEEGVSVDDIEVKTILVREDEEIHLIFSRE